MHKVEINELGVCLDGKPLKGVRSYSIDQEEGENIATLLLKMDVTILPNSIHFWMRMESELNENSNSLGLILFHTDSEPTDSMNWYPIIDKSFI